MLCHPLPSPHTAWATFPIGFVNLRTKALFLGNTNRSILTTQRCSRYSGNLLKRQKTSQRKLAKVPFCNSSTKKNPKNNRNQNPKANKQKPIKQTKTPKKLQLKISQRKNDNSYLSAWDGNQSTVVASVQSPNIRLSLGQCFNNKSSRPNITNHSRTQQMEKPTPIFNMYSEKKTTWCRSDELISRTDELTSWPTTINRYKSLLICSVQSVITSSPLSPTLGAMV